MTWRKHPATDAWTRRYPGGWSASVVPVAWRWRYVLRGEGEKRTGTGATADEAKALCDLQMGIGERGV